MATTDLSQPPPTQNGMLDRWLFLLWKKLTAGGSITWNQIALPSTSANQFLAGPSSGAASAAAFRAIVAADVPQMTLSQLQAFAAAHG